MSDPGVNRIAFISLLCPHCRETYKAPKEAAGKTFKCKKCGNHIQIARVRSAQSSPPNTPTEANGAHATPARSSSNSQRIATQISTAEGRPIGASLGVSWFAVATAGFVAAAGECLAASGETLSVIEKADSFVRPALASMMIATLMLAAAFFGHLILKNTRAKWFSLLGHVTWPTATVTMLLLFSIPHSYRFPYVSTSLTDLIATSHTDVIVLIFAKYVFLTPTVLMIGIALLGMNSPVMKGARATLQHFANWLWFPVQLALLLYFAPWVWWVRKRYPSMTMRLKNRITKQSLHLGRTAEPLLSKYMGQLPDNVRNAFTGCTDSALQIHTWRVERGQDEDHGIKKALEAAASVIGERMSDAQKREIGSLQVAYDESLCRLGLVVLSLPSTMLRDLNLEDCVEQVRNTKEVAILGEIAEQGLAESQSTLPLGVRSTYRTLQTATLDLRACRDRLGLTEQKSLKNVFSVAASALRHENLSPEKQSQLNALGTKRDLAVRQFGLALISAPIDLLREIGLEQPATRMRESREVFDLGAAAEAMLSDSAAVEIPIVLSTAITRAKDAARNLEVRRNEFGVGKPSGILKRVFGAVTLPFGTVSLSLEQKTQLESVSTKRDDALRILGATMLAAPETLFVQLGLMPRLQKLLGSKEAIAFGEMGFVAVTSCGKHLPDWLDERHDKLTDATKALEDFRHELGLDQSKGFTTAISAAVSQFGGGLTANDKQELESLVQRRERAKRSLGVAMLCATGDWSPPETIARQIDELRRAKTIVQLAKTAEKTLPNFRTNPSHTALAPQ